MHADRLAPATFICAPSAHRAARRSALVRRDATGISFAAAESVAGVRRIQPGDGAGAMNFGGEIVGDASAHCALRCSVRPGKRT